MSLRKKEKKLKYISLQEASKLCLYSQEYLSLRARQGKLQAIKKGRNWVTTVDWLNHYVKEKKLKYISLQEASKLCLYSQEYLSLRARQGKLQAIKKGRNWVTTVDWLNHYVKERGNGVRKEETTIAYEEKRTLKSDLIGLGRYIKDILVKANQKKDELLLAAERAKKALASFGDSVGLFIDKGLSVADKIIHFLAILLGLIKKYTLFLLPKDQEAAQLPKIYQPKFILNILLIILIVSLPVLSMSKRSVIDDLIGRTDQFIAGASADVVVFLENQGYKAAETFLNLNNAGRKTQKLLEDRVEIPTSFSRGAGKSALAIKVAKFSKDAAFIVRIAAKDSFMDLLKRVSIIYNKADKFNRELKAKFKSRIKVSFRCFFEESLVMIRGFPDRLTDLDDWLRDDGHKIIINAAKETQNSTKELFLFFREGINSINNNKEKFVKKLSILNDRDLIDRKFKEFARFLSDELPVRVSLMQKAVSDNSRKMAKTLTLDVKRMGYGLRLGFERNKADFLERLTGFNKRVGRAGNNFIKSIPKRIDLASKKIKDKLGDAYLKIAGYLAPDYYEQGGEISLSGPARDAEFVKKGVSVPAEVADTGVTPVKPPEEAAQPVPVKESALSQESVNQTINQTIIKEKEIIVEKESRVIERVESADLTGLKEDIGDLSQRITTLSNNISSKINYSVPSYAPVYIPSSGLQVSGHSVLSTLNVSGSGSVGGSFGVRKNAAFGDPLDTTGTTFTVESVATFNKTVSANEGLTVSGSVSAGALSASSISTNSLLTSSSTQISATTTDTVLTVRQGSTGDILNIYDGTTEVLTVLDGGNIGMGTSTPDSKLVVLGKMHASSTSEQLRLSYDDQSSKYASFTIDSNGDLMIDLAASGATTTFADNLKFEGNTTSTAKSVFVYSPALAGEFNANDSSIYINPSSAVADANLLSIANDGTWKFRVDREGDVFVQGNITTAGTVQQATTSIQGNLTVEGWSRLGDAPNNDNTEIKGYTVIRASTTDPVLTLDQSSTGAMLQVLGDGTEVFSIDADGNATSTGGAISVIDNTEATYYKVGQAFDTSMHFGWQYNATPANAFGSISTWQNTYPIYYAAASHIFSNGQVGIGATTTPWGHLSVEGAGTNPALVVSDSSDNTDFIVDADGNVGIGTAEPNSLLHVSGGDISLELNRYLYFDADATPNSFIRYNNAATPYLEFRTDNNLGMVIKNDGNVGIGTTSPDGLLHLAKDSSLSAYISQATTDNDGAELIFRKSRGTHASPVNSAGSDILGAIRFQAYPGDWSEQANIIAGHESGNQTTYLAFGTYSWGELEEVMRIDSNGNVGIGDISPVSLLEIASTTADTAMTFTSGAGSWTMGMDYSNSGYFTIASSTALGTNDRVVIDNNGNVGIGTTGPDNKLHVVGPTFPVFQSERTTAATNEKASSYRLLTTSSGNMADGFGGGIVFGIEDDAETPNNIAAIYGLRDGADNSGELAFDTWSAGAQTTRMTIDNNGNVGIGTTTPVNMLTVYDTTDKGLGFSGASGDTYKWTMGIDMTDAGKFKIASSTALGANDRLTIDGSGNVGIGTTEPSKKLDVVHSAAGVVDGLRIAATGDSYPGMYFGRTGGSAWTNRAWLFTLGTDGSYILQDSTAAKNRFAVTTGGDFYFSDAYVAGSQDNIMSITNSSGLVKIGSGADSPSLSSGTSLYVTRDGNTNAVIRNSTDDVEIGFGAWSVAFFGTRTNDDMYFQTNAENRMVLDTSGNVGIGTTSPDALVDIYRSSGGTETLLEVGTSTDPNIFVVKSNGNVGIGTAAPGAKLQVQGTYPQVRISDGTDFVHLGAQSVTGTLWIKGPSAGTWLAMESGGTALSIFKIEDGEDHAQAIPGASGGYYFFEDSGSGENQPVRVYGYDSGVAGVKYGMLNVDATGDFNIEAESGEVIRFRTGGGDKVSILNDGNVGIGTATPGDKLEVYGDAPEIRISDDSSEYTILGQEAGDNDFYISRLGTGGNDINIQPDGDIIIGQNGNVGINTTTPKQLLSVDNGAFCVDDGTGICGTVGGGVAGDIYYGTAHSNWTDVAEKYPSEQDLEPGDVVVFDLENSTYVRKATTSYQTTLAGVVSTKPGMILGDIHNRNSSRSSYSIALVGRVPVKVTLDNGPIKIGDSLTSASSTAGYAMKATKPGKIIGYALEDFDGESATPTILVFVNLGWEGAELTIERDKNGALVERMISVEELILTNADGERVRLALDQDGFVVVDKIRAKIIETEQLCLDDVCIDKEQLQELLSKSQTSSGPESVSEPEPEPEPGPEPKEEQTEEEIIEELEEEPVEEELTEESAEETPAEEEPADVIKEEPENIEEIATVSEKNDIMETEEEAVEESVVINIEENTEEAAVPAENEEDSL